MQAQSGVEFLYAEYVWWAQGLRDKVVEAREVDKERERERALQPESRCSMISPADVIPFSQQRYS